MTRNLSSRPRARRLPRAKNMPRQVAKIMPKMTRDMISPMVGLMSLIRVRSGMSWPSTVSILTSSASASSMSMTR